MMDDVDAACGLMKNGEIVAIKGIGGYQLACDATRADGHSGGAIIFALCSLLKD